MLNVIFYTYSLGSDGAWLESGFKSKKSALKRIKKVFGSVHLLKDVSKEKIYDGEWYKSDNLRDGYIECYACLKETK